MARRAFLFFAVFVSLCLFCTEVALAARHLQQSTPTTGGGSTIPGLPSFPFPTIPTLPSSLPSIPPMPSIPTIPTVPSVPKFPSIPQIPGVPKFQIPPMTFSAPPPS